MRARPRSDAATKSSPTGESNVSKRTSTNPSPRAAARERASRSGVTFMCPPQSADAGRRGGARRILGGAEGVGDLGVREVVAVAEHDGRAFRRRKPARQVLQLAKGVALQLDPRLVAGLEAVGLLLAQVVQRDVRRDREHPGAQVLAVLE